MKSQSTSVTIRELWSSFIDNDSIVIVQKGWYFLYLGCVVIIFRNWIFIDLV
jgi:hypothetical protein